MMSPDTSALLASVFTDTSLIHLHNELRVSIEADIAEAVMREREACALAARSRDEDAAKAILARSD